MQSRLSQTRLALQKLKLPTKQQKEQKRAQPPVDLAFLRPHFDHANHLPGTQQDPLLGLDPHVQVTVAVFGGALLRDAMAAFPAALSALEGPQAPGGPGRAGWVPVAEGHLPPPLPLSPPPSLSSPPRLPRPPPLPPRTTPLPPRRCPHADAPTPLPRLEPPTGMAPAPSAATLRAGTRLFLEDHGLVSSARRSPSPPPSAPPAALTHHAPDATGAAVGPGFQWEVDSSGILARFAGTRLYTVAPSPS